MGANAWGPATEPGPRPPFSLPLLRGPPPGLQQLSPAWDILQGDVLKDKRRREALLTLWGLFSLSPRIPACSQDVLLLSSFCESSLLLWKNKLIS